MYYSVFTFYKMTDDENSETNNNTCVICWHDKNVYKMSELLEQNKLISGCNCNPKLHVKCFTDWINMSNSCPICRKNIKKVIIDKMSYNMLLFDYTFGFFKFLWTLSIMHLSFLTIYNIYFACVKVKHDED